MKIQNNNISFTSYDANAARDSLNVIKKAAKNATRQYKKDSNNPDAMKVFIATLDDLKKQAKKIREAASASIPAETPSKILNAFGNVMAAAANSKVFKWAADSKNKNTLAYVLVGGNACKEAMGTAIYTTQALTNEDLPQDKRKFVGMYDLAVGVVSTTLSLAAGFLMVKGQDTLVKKLIGGTKAEKLPGVTKAIAGMSFLLPVVLQTILIKRIIAPAVGTPIAGNLKKNMEAREAAKKGVKPSNEEQPIVIPSEALILSHNDFIQRPVNQFRQKLDAKI